jgi:protein-disulfide isomerase
MTRVVESVASQYEADLKWEKVVTKINDGAKRLFDLSIKLGHLLPVPSILINGKLAFDSIPSPAELKAFLDQELMKRRNNPG